MHALLSAAGRAFLRAFVAAILILTPGVLAAPNLNESFALGVAALFAAVAAGVRVLQAYVPELSVARYAPSPYGAWADAFLQAALGALVITLPGVLNAPDLATARSIGTAALVGAVTAGVHALQSLSTKGQDPGSTTGVLDPRYP